MKLPSHLLLTAVLLATCVTTTHAAGPTLSAVRVGSRIDIQVGGQFFTSYRFAEDEKYPYFFPLNGPSGAGVTSMRNGAFPHHSSLFFGCDRVNGGNYWQDTLERGRIISQGPVIEQASGTEVVLTDRCVWQREGSMPLSDERRIVFRAPDARLRIIDFSITLEALEEVVIQKTNHSLFSARIDPDLTPAFGGTLLNAEGATGEKGTFGKPSPWLACHGPRGDTREGLAILQHPSNPGYPSPWFTRDYGFLSPTPMYWPADGKITRLAKGEKLALRYRVLVFAGEPDLAALFKAFAK